MVANESRAAPLAAVNISAVILATTVTALRCYVRVHLLKAFGTDDWLMAAAAGCFAIYCSFSLSGVANGTGQHEANLRLEDRAAARKFWWCCYPSYAVTMMLTKLSITFFFRRIIVRRLHKWILTGAAAVTVISCTVFFFACIFQCWPVSYFWDKHSQTGSCIPDQVVIALALLFSAINIVTDFTFALMPAWILSHLTMRLKTKVLLSILMGLGCVASTAVVVRVPYMHFIASDDFLYDTVDVAIWSTVEQALAITAGGLATLQPLFKLIGYKLGLRTHPSLPGRPGPGPADNVMGGMQMMEGGGRGGIAVQRSFITQLSKASTVAQKTQYDQLAMKLQLQPGAGVYSAICYNTSREILTPSRELDERPQVPPKDVDLERGGFGRHGEIPVVYMPNANRHTFPAARLGPCRFGCGGGKGK